MHLVYLYGPPGVGKLTVARALAARTGFKIYHNHVSIDAVLPVFEFGTAPFWKLVHQMRRDMLEAVTSEGVDLIITNVYAHPDDAPRIEWYLEAVEQHGGRVACVQLTCALEELERRVTAAERVAMRKLATLELLRETVSNYELFTPLPDRDSLRIDNTSLSPDAVATRIIQHYGLPLAAS